MDFNTFKKNEFQNILAQFLHPSTINFYRKKYGIEPTDFENNISSYEELYSTVGYAFLFFGNAIAKTLCDIRMCENSPSPSTTMNRFPGFLNCWEPGSEPPEGKYLLFSKQYPGEWPAFCEIRNGLFRVGKTDIAFEGRCPISNLWPHLESEYGLRAYLLGPLPVPEVEA